MNSRIILTQADFSANNIGRYVELSDLTKKVLAKQTLYDSDSTEAIALNTFLAGLTDNGFIGGNDPLIKYLIIPALADNNDQLLYNIAELDSEGYPTDKRSDAEKAATDKVFKRYTINDSIKGLYVDNTNLDSATFDAQNKQILDGFFTKYAKYPSMSVCMWCPKALSNANDRIFNFGGGYEFVMRKSIVGLISENISDKYLKAPISGLGAGFIGITCDEANEQIIGMLDNGTLGTVESLNATSITQSGSEDYYNRFYLGGYTNDSNRKFHVSIFAFGKAMTSEQMTQFKTLLTPFLTSLNIISE